MSGTEKPVAHLRSLENVEELRDSISLLINRLQTFSYLVIAVRIGLLLSFIVTCVIFFASYFKFKHDTVLEYAAVGCCVLLLYLVMTATVFLTSHQCVEIAEESATLDSNNPGEYFYMAKKAMESMKANLVVSAISMTPAIGAVLLYLHRLKILSAT